MLGLQTDLIEFEAIKSYIAFFSSNDIKLKAKNQKSKGNLPNTLKLNNIQLRNMRSRLCDSRVYHRKNRGEGKRRRGRLISDLSRKEFMVESFKMSAAESKQQMQR